MTFLEKASISLTLCMTLGFMGFLILDNQSTTEFVVTVERKAEPTTSAEKTGDEVASPEIIVEFPININTATILELMELPNIGEKRADDILQFRETQGEFESPDEIMLVSGIGEGIFTEIESLITVE